MDKQQENKFVMVAHNHVAVKAPDYLYQAFINVLKETPIRPVAGDTLHVSIFTSKTPLTTFNPDKEKEYRITVGKAELWLDPYLGCTNLIVNVTSSDLISRHQEIENRYNGVSVYPHYTPHLTIAYDLPAHTRTRKAILNAFIDYVDDYLMGEEVSLSGEYLESTSGLSQILGVGQNP